MRLKKLAESIRSISEEALIESAKLKGKEYGDAVAFFKKGILPDGSSWGRPLNFRFGYDNEPVVSRDRIKDTKTGKEYSARIHLLPGKGGGSGISIDAPASNHLFNMMGTEPKIIQAVGKAFLEAVKRKSRKLNYSFARWLKEKDNFLHHIVDWENRDKYKIDDVIFKSIRYETPMVDPTRRKWPSGRTEIWVPVTADVVINLKDK